MAEDAFGFHIKATMMRRALRVFQANVSSRRELLIQIDKLESLAKKFDKKFSMVFVLSTPPEKHRQKKASDLHRLTLQAKHVDDLFSRMIVELLERNNPHEIPVKRKAFVMRARRFTALYNKQINQDVKAMRLEAKSSALMEFSASELPSGKA
ncbi:MAG: hypothetical protein ACJ72H_06275 [Candidatus Sulfotelmatobacter sp.]